MSGFLNSMVGATYAAPVPPETYWFGHTQGGGADDNPRSYIDADSNVYGIIETSSATLIGNRDIYVWKRDSDGTVQWSRRIGQSNKSFTNGGITADSTGNAYIFFYTSSYLETYVIKINTSGDISWAKQVRGTRTTDFQTFGAGNTLIATDNTNVHIIGYSGNDNPNYQNEIITIACSDGSHVRSRQLTPFGGSAAANSRHSGIHCDSSGNLYAVHGEGVDCVLAKYNSSGTIQWKKNFDVTGLDRVQNMVVDSSGSIYVNYDTDSLSCISKISSDGATVNWTKTSSDNTIGGHIATDGTNVYWFNNTGLTNGGWMITKFNSSGTSQWQRQIYAASGSNAYRYCAANAYAFVGSARQTYTNTDAVQFKIPLDGTKTGTYTLGGKDFTYTSNTLTIGTEVTPTTSTSSASTGTGSGASTDYTAYSTNTTALTYNLVTLT
jgi:hypothetical protein